MDDVWHDRAAAIGCISSFTTATAAHIRSDSHLNLSTVLFCFPNTTLHIGNFHFLRLRRLLSGYESSNILVGGGYWQPDAPALSKLRRDIDRKPHKIKAVLTNELIRKAFLGNVKHDEKKAVKAFVNLSSNKSTALKRNPKVSKRFHMNKHASLLCHTIFLSTLIAVLVNLSWIQVCLFLKYIAREVLAIKRQSRCCNSVPKMLSNQTCNDSRVRRWSRRVADRYCTQGYEHDHRDIELLRLRNFTMGKNLADDEVIGSKGLERIAELVHCMVPFVSGCILIAQRQQNLLPGHIRLLTLDVLALQLPEGTGHDG